jgi:hypothetical protein
MPQPGKFKGEGAKKRWMQQCMHQTLHKEQKSPEQSKAQCLNMWRKTHGGEPAPKKAVSEHIRELAKAIKE